MQKIAVIGSGAFGTALAAVLEENGYNVLIYGIDHAEISELQNHHTNSKYFGDTPLSPKIGATFSLSEALSDLYALILAVPSHVLPQLVDSIAAQLSDPNVLIVNCAKGLDPQTHQPLSCALQEKFSKVGALHGPSFAQELLAKSPTCLMSVSESEAVAHDIADIFSNYYVHVHPHTDLRGAEYTAALKNCVAIMCGIAKGLYNTHNAQASLFTLGVSDIKRFILHQGAKIETLFSFAGLGDLFLTAAHQLSRNFLFGQEIGAQGLCAPSVSALKTTIEGVTTCQALYLESKKQGLHLPVIEGLHQILFENRSPRAALTELLNQRPMF